MRLFLLIFIILACKPQKDDLNVSGAAIEGPDEAKIRKEVEKCVSRIESLYTEPIF